MKLRIVLFFVLLNFSAFGQEKLSLPMAQNLALENNWGIKITEKQAEIVEYQAYKGNAGMSPILDWNSSLYGSINQVHQKYIDGRDIQRWGNSYSPVSSLNLSWTLYDGKRMFATLDRLKTQGQQSRLQNQLQIQNTLVMLMQAYYDISRLQTSVEYQNQIIKYYQERLDLTEQRWQIGRGSKLDYLQSKTDFSTQKSNLINLESLLKIAKIRLNGIISRPSTVDFVVESKILLNTPYVLSELIDNAKSKNQDFLILKKSEEINLLQQKEATSYLLPKINLNSAFGFNFNKTNANLLSFNQQIGLNAGLTATWRLFDGNYIKRNIQTTKINNQLIQIQKSQLINEIENDLNAAYSQFETDKTLMSLEIENKALAEENLTISLAKFKLGSSTILELNDAQTRYNTALTRLVNSEYNVKISELELLRISGNLIH